MARKFIYVNADGDYQETPGAYEQSDFIAVSAGAADAGKPIVLDAAGLIDGSLIDESVIHHGDLDGLGDDDHTQYILADGTRAFSGNQALGGNLLTGVQDPVNAQDAATKAYVDLIAQGLKPKANVEVATTGNITLASAPSAIDGFSLTSGDRVLVHAQTDDTENGVYVFNGAGSAMTRADDWDCSVPDGEFYNGTYTPRVLNGATYQDYSVVVVSTGSGTGGSHVCGTDSVAFTSLSSPSAYSGDVGITLDHGANTIAVDLVDTGSGLAFGGVSSDELTINWCSSFTINSPEPGSVIAATDLCTTALYLGASIVGIHDTADNFAANNVEDALAELAGAPPPDFNTFAAGEAISKGDLLYMSGADTVSILPIGNNYYAVGIAGADALIAADVPVLKDDTLITGILTGATAGNKYYWNGTDWTTSIPSGGGAYVWRLGCAVNSTDGIVETEFIKRNSA